MPFDPSELDSLEDGFEPEIDPDDHDDEDEDDPSTWDLTHGRADDHHPRLVPATDLDVADLITVVWDGVAPDGSKATIPMRANALEAWKDKDPTLHRQLYIALTGATPEGAPASLDEREAAVGYVRRRRKRWLESGDVLAPTVQVGGQGRKPSGKHAVRITSPDGRIRFEHLGNDDQAVEEAAELLSGASIDELRAPFKQGPQSDAENARRARQSLTIHQLTEQGATQRAIGRVFDLAPARVSERAAIGRRLAERLS